MDAEAFDAFYAASFSRLVGQVYAMCADYAEAQDCVQEAFVRGWDRRRQLEQAKSPEAWIRTVAWRLAISRWRHARRAFVWGDRSLKAAALEPGVDHTGLIMALKHLTPEQRRAVVLHYLCDMSVTEVAAETGVPEGTVKARLSRGRAALALLLADDEATEETRNA